MKEASGKRTYAISVKLYYSLGKSKAVGFIKSPWVFRKGMRGGKVKELKYGAQFLLRQRNCFLLHCDGGRVTLT